MTREESSTAEVFEAPALLRAEHVVLNPDAPKRIRRYAVKDETPLGRAYEKGQLTGGSRAYTADDRLKAGKAYRQIWDTMHATRYACIGESGTRGGGTDMRHADALCIARDLFKRIEAHMAPASASIIRMVCGEDKWPSEAVRSLFAGYQDAVSARFCEALDELITALVTLKLQRLTDQV